ncbi:MAG: hypothetical protein H6Q13_2861 [Bacteroidetes bacterium]|nr:hypothetical protein [Bacteroidota bacterium]
MRVSFVSLEVQKMISAMENPDIIHSFGKVKM